MGQEGRFHPDSAQVTKGGFAPRVSGDRPAALGSAFAKRSQGQPNLASPAEPLGRGGRVLCGPCQPREEAWNNVMQSIHTHRWRRIFRASLVLLALIFGVTGADAADAVPAETPLWWPDALERGRDGGYGLLSLAELRALLSGGSEYVLLDVRPEYEFKEGHIPGAVNFEFHLGHRNGLEPERAEALKELLGPPGYRMVVVYCRNFR